METDATGRTAVTPGTSRTVTDEAGRRIRYATYGAAEGRPVLLLHGTPGAHTFGRLFDDVAAEAGVRLLCPARPGYADSATRPDRTLEDVPMVVKPVFDATGAAEVSVVGFSGGGPHAFALAATLPDRVASVDVVAGAVPPAVGESAVIQRLLTWEARRVPWFLRRFVRGQAWVGTHVSEAAVLSQFTGPGGVDEIPPWIREAVVADFAAAVAGGGHGFVTETRLLAKPWPFALDSVGCPVTFHHGSADANVPLAGVRTLTERLPDASLEVVDGADHLGTLLAAREAVLDD